MNCAHNSSISIDKYLPEKSCNSIDTEPSHLPGGRSPGHSRMVQDPLPAATPQLLANAEGWGFPTLVQGSSSTLETPLTCTHIAQTPAQQPGRQVQAALTLQPCKLRQRGKSRQRLKWDYFLMGATTTTHHNCPRGNYKKLSIAENEALSFSRWAVSTRKL